MRVAAAVRAAASALLAGGRCQAQPPAGCPFAPKYSDPCSCPSHDQFYPCSECTSLGMSCEKCRTDQGTADCECYCPEVDPTPAPVVPTPAPRTPQPAPPTPPRYHCDASKGACSEQGSGHSTMAKCMEACSASTPAPTPAPTGAPGPVVQITTYHLVPAEYTGLANKNTGNVKGDIEYALSTLHTCTNGPNHRCMDQQVVETVQVSVYGNYSTYKQCNVDPAAGGRYVCCDGEGKKGEPPCPATASCLVGRELKKKFAGGGEGYWYSWPQCGEGVSWAVTAPPKRINASCVGNGWRKLAGGCPACGPALDECVSGCIGNATDVGIDQLENVWYSIVQDNDDACPSIPVPPHTPSPLPPAAPADPTR